MKKILLVALIALCGASFGFGAENTVNTECYDCIVMKGLENCNDSCPPNLTMIKGNKVKQGNTKDINSDFKIPNIAGNDSATVIVPSEKMQ